MNDQKTVRLVIVTLGLLAFAVVVGGIVLALDDKGLPGELIAIGAAAAGAVGGILSKTGAPGEPLPVTGEHGGPVLTADVAGGESGQITPSTLLVVVLIVVLLLILL